MPAWCATSMARRCAVQALVSRLRLARAAAHREARTRELVAIHAAVARVMERAGELVDEAAGSPAYLAALPRHTEEALSFVEGLQPRVECHSRLAPHVAAIVEHHPGARLVIDDSKSPGVVAEAGDGSVAIDNTLRARLERCVPRIASTLARKLADGGR